VILGVSGGGIIDEKLSSATLLGVAGISGGRAAGRPVARVGRSHRRAAAVRAAQRADHRQLHHRRRIGVRASGNALQYVALLFLLDGLPYFLLV